MCIRDRTRRDHVCVAARDINGDGMAEIAVAGQWNIGESNNAEKSGAVFYLKPSVNRKGNWLPIQLPHEPSTHRMHWIKSGKGKFELVVKPLYGPKRDDGRKQVSKV